VGNAANPKDSPDAPPFDRTAASVAQGKLDALSRLSALTVHQVNNILGGLLGYAQLMGEKKGHENCPLVAALRKHAEPCVHLSQRLMRFATRRSGAIELANPAELLDDVLGLLGKDLQARRLAISRPQDHLPQCRIQAADFQFALLALLWHIAESAPDGSQVNVHMSVREQHLSLGLVWNVQVGRAHTQDANWALAAGIVDALEPVARTPLGA
jgi:nitrogen-specific signal transduction histidine kinase